MRGIQTQFTQLQKGFQELVSQHLLRPFDERELEVWPSYRKIIHQLYIDNLRSLCKFDDFFVTCMVNSLNP